MDFLSPTTHHESLPPEAAGGKAGKIGYPLPDPLRTVTSWFHKWNSLMARLQRAPFSEELPAALRGLALSRMHGETQAVRLGERQQLVGYVGSAVFELLGSPPPAAARALTVLARFANYAGTGVETLRGMGQTRARLLP